MEEFDRLRGIYRDMGDAELMELGGKLGDLTGKAREALTEELEERGLPAPTYAEGLDPTGEVGMPTAADLMPGYLGAVAPEMELRIFYDAMEAGRACEFLDEAGIPFHVADMTEERSGLGTLDGGPAVALRVAVPLTDFERAKAILRKGMGLFPLQEIETADEMVDDGTRTAVGYFSTKEDAEEIAGILTGAGFRYWLKENPEGSEAEENRYAVEVREVDLFAAGEAVDKALEVGE
jgi:hypothetical protein